jgi:DNA-binding response OmpR family regulator
MEHENEILTKEKIYRTIWQVEYDGNDGALKTRLAHLRRKIGGSGYAITSVRKTGLRFEKKDETKA